MIYTCLDGTIIEYSITKNNCKIISSYQIKKKVLKFEFLEFLVETYPEFQKRTLKSYYREWKAHNILYKLKIKPSSTRDTDLNINENMILRFGYYIIAILPDF